MDWEAFLGRMFVGQPKLLADLTESFDPQVGRELYLRSLDRDRLPIRDITDDQVRASLVWGAQYYRGTELGFDPLTQLGIVVLPEGMRIRHSIRDTHRDWRTSADITIVGTTFVIPDIKGPKGSRTIENYASLELPSEGFRDSTGIVQPFMKRAPKDHEQHGGFFIDNAAQTVDILDYPSLEKAKTMPLTPDQQVLEANWYMDSDNQNSVKERPNLQRVLPFNTLGVLQGDNGSSRLFCLTTSPRAIDDIVLFGDMDESLIGFSRGCLVREIVAVSNVVAEQMGAKRWALDGLEFNGGGIFLGPYYFPNLFTLNY